MDEPMKLVVTGANSSVGLALLKHLAGQADLSVVAGVRSERAASGLPEASNIRPAVISYTDEDGLEALFRGADNVVHLAGILFEQRGSRYREANVRTTASVASAARRAGVSHLLFVSVIGADAASSNAYWRSKGEAEQCLMESGLPATAIRTPMLLGPGTAGGAALVATAGAARARLPGGGRYRVRPLDVDDLVRTIVETCWTPPGGAVIRTLVGPETLSYQELVLRMARLLDNHPRVASVPVGLLRFLAAVRHGIRRAGMSPDIVDVITADESAVAEQGDGEPESGATPLQQTLEKLINTREGDT